MIENATTAKDSVVDSAQGIATAAGIAFAPREDRRESRPYSNEIRERRRSDRPPRDGLGERRAPPADLKPTNAIYVGNLLFDIAEGDLEREFAKYGSIERVRIAKDNSGLSKG